MRLEGDERKWLDGEKKKEKNKAEDEIFGDIDQSGKFKQKKKEKKQTDVLQIES